MGKKSITVRLEAELVEALDAYAETNGKSRTQAVEDALEALLDGSVRDGEPTADAGKGSADGALMEALRASNADLRAALVDTRATVAALTAQLSVKDEQIARAHELVDQSHRLQMAEVQRGRKALPGPRGEGLMAKIRRLTGHD